MSCFLVLPQGGVVGYSVWPHDPHYRPVVGLFDKTTLVGHGLCNLTRPGTPRIPSRLLLRLARRLGMAERLLVPVPMEGPVQNCWFSFDPGRELSERLRREDLALRLARLADGEELTPVARKARLPAHVRTVDQILQLPDRMPSIKLDGFPYLLQAPYEHQLEVTYLDLLGRMPDENAYRDYQPQLESGAWSLTRLQQTLLDSQEFRSRPLTSNDRVGAFMTSHLWAPLSQAQTPDSPARPAPVVASRLQDV